MTTHIDDWQLFPRDVRKIAVSVSRCKELKNEGHPDILTFLLLDEEGEPARIQVYCKTGTVGVCRVLNNEVREMFQRKCTILQVHQIFNQPMHLPTVDPKLFDEEGRDEERQSREHEVSSNDRSNSDVSDPMISLQTDERLLDIGISILGGEFDNLVSHYKSILREKNRQDKQKEELELQVQKQLQQNLAPKIKYEQKPIQQKQIQMETKTTSIKTTKTIHSKNYMELKKEQMRKQLHLIRQRQNQDV